MSWLSDIFAGSASGALEGIGGLAVKLREAITGELPADKRAELESMALQIESAAKLAQNKVNEVEARHSSIFVAGWRPGVGWVCAAGLAYQFVLYPLLCWGLAVYYPNIPAPPPLDSNSLMGLVTSMLGMGTIRQYGKNKGQG
jgi:hypothetical protein